MGGTHLNDDIVTKVLSRLSTENLSANKCVSKRWNSLISNPSFWRLHSHHSGLSGLFCQMHGDTADFFYRSATYIPLGEEESKMQETILDFLPEKVVIIDSCNGLLCCRSCFLLDESKQPVEWSTYGLIFKDDTMNSSNKLVIYVCNPTTKEYIALRPIGSHVGDSFGLAFYPFGSSSNAAATFKLVSIQRPKRKLYSFVIFSSETGRWTVSKEVCYWDSNIHKSIQIFVGGRFHWLTWNHHIITFDVERELSGVIKLPGPIIVGEGHHGICLGCSEQYLNYVCAHGSEVRVWMLKDYHKAEWVLKHRLHLLEFYKEHEALLSYSLFSEFSAEKDADETEFSCALLPLAFREEVLFMNLDRCLFSYSFKTGRLKRHCSTIILEGFITVMPTVLP